MLLVFKHFRSDFFNAQRWATLLCVGWAQNGHSYGRVGLAQLVKPFVRRECSYAMKLIDSTLLKSLTARFLAPKWHSPAFICTHLASATVYVSDYGTGAMSAISHFLQVQDR